MSIVLSLIGLCLNLAGSLAIAFSVIENPSGAYQMINGKKVRLAAIKMSLFRFGVGILILGFILQLIAAL